MPSLKEIKSRINSVKSTRKITSAMRMVASAKLHHAQAAIENMLPYQKKMNGILTSFLGATDQSFSSAYTVQREVRRVALVVYSSNSTLCGGFNANVIRLLNQTIDTYSKLGKENILIYPIGRKVEEAVGKLGYASQGSFQEMADKPNYEAASKLAQELMASFVEEKIDKVELIYHHFKSAGSQQLLHQPFLPIDLTAIDTPEEEDKKASALRIDYIVEPSVDEFIAGLLPQVLQLKIFTALLDSNASEHAARMLAMQTATDNANDLIQDLTKQYNKSRQQAITSELLDIIGGSMR